MKFEKKQLLLTCSPRPACLQLFPPGRRDPGGPRSSAAAEDQRTWPAAPPGWCQRGEFVQPGVTRTTTRTIPRLVWQVCKIIIINKRKSWRFQGCGAWCWCLQLPVWGHWATADLWTCCKTTFCDFLMDNIENIETDRLEIDRKKWQLNVTSRSVKAERLVVRVK